MQTPELCIGQQGKHDSEALLFNRVVTPGQIRYRVVTGRHELHTTIEYASHSLFDVPLILKQARWRPKASRSTVVFAARDGIIAVQPELLAAHCNHESVGTQKR